MLFSNLLTDSFKRKVKDRLGVPSLNRTLSILKNAGFNPKLTIDAGAYKGEWTVEFTNVFPRANVLMVEAQSSKQHILQNVCNKTKNTSFVIGLLSSEHNKQVSFVEDETVSHIQMDGSREGALKATTTLDKIIESRGSVYPDMIKLDVQGHEIEVLKGAEKCLQHAEVCLLEVSFLDLGYQHPLFFEVLQFMDAHSFQVYDISHFIRIPYSDALYQGDVFFVKKGSELAKVNRWS